MDRDDCVICGGEYGIYLFGEVCIGCYINDYDRAMGYLLKWYCMECIEEEYNTKISVYFYTGGIWRDMDIYGKRHYL